MDNTNQILNNLRTYIAKFTLPNLHQQQCGVFCKKKNVMFITRTKILTSFSIIIYTPTATNTIREQRTRPGQGHHQDFMNGLEIYKIEVKVFLTQSVG